MRTLLASFALATCFMVAMLMVPPVSSVAATPERALDLSVPQLSSQEEQLLGAMRQVEPEVAADLERRLEGLAFYQRDHLETRRAILRSSLGTLWANAGLLAQAHLRDLDQMVGHVETGLTALKVEQSDWCKATIFKKRFSVAQSQIKDNLFETLAASDEAYDWALEFATLTLNAVQRAKQHPLYPGRRTRADESALQAAGLDLAIERPMVAISIANFAYSDGRGYRQMQNTLETISVCETGLTLMELTRRIPARRRARIYAEFLPPVFRGDTRRAVYLINDYFYVDAG